MWDSVRDPVLGVTGLLSIAPPWDTSGTAPAPFPTLISPLQCLPSASWLVLPQEGSQTWVRGEGDVPWGQSPKDRLSQPPQSIPAAAPSSSLPHQPGRKRWHIPGKQLGEESS